jgi:hypothetical protein
MTIYRSSRTMSTKFSIFAENRLGGPSMFHLQSLCENHAREFDKLKNNIDWLVTEEGAESFYELDEDEKDKLVGLLLKALDDQSEWFMECNDADMIMSSLARFMTEPGNDEKEYFVSVTKANAIKYWGHHLDDLIRATHAEYKRDLAMNHVDGQIDERLGMGF